MRRGGRGAARRFRRRLVVGGAAACIATAAAAPPPSERVLVVMESCDLWSSAAMWRSVLSRAPRNRPPAGPYDDGRPEVADRHVAFLLSAGVSAAQSCWFRDRGNAGRPVTARFDGFIRALAAGGGDRNRIAWSLFWDNGNPVGDGVSGPADFLDHVVAFWIDGYLRRPNYLRLDGRPVLVIADAARLVSQLGGPGPARDALREMRRRVGRAGLPGVVLLTCNNGDPARNNRSAAAAGFDGVMAYATPAFTGLLRTGAPDDAAVMDAERRSWDAWQAASALPSAVTVSVGYDARIWSDGSVHYQLSAPDFAILLRQGLAAARARPPGSLGRRLLYLDNWNEYGEGHFIEPSVAYGDAYLRAVAAVLRPSAGPAP